MLQELEISKELYDTFNVFELVDLSHLNVVDRHLEQSEVWENTSNARAFYQPETVEDIVFHNIQVQHLHRAIKQLLSFWRFSEETGEKEIYFQLICFLFIGKWNE